MMNKYYINGEIVGRQAYKTTSEDVCPQDIQDYLQSLSEGEDAVLYFNSFGGDVLAGLQICSLLKEASANGHKTVANVTSIAASIASVIACACDELNLYSGCYIMTHLPWSCVQGNVKDLQKEISTLEQCKNSMIKIYKSKFDMTDDEIVAMLEAETWIDSDNYATYKLSCNIVDNDMPIKIAASIANKKFKNLPKGLKMTEENNEQAVAALEQIEQEVQDAIETTISAEGEKPEEAAEEEEEEERRRRREES